MTDREIKWTVEATERATAALRDARIPLGPPPTVVKSTLDSLQTLENTPVVVRDNKRRELMFRIGRYSGVAATLSLLVIGGWFLLSGPGTKVSFAQVVEKFRDTKSFSYEVVSEPLGNTQSPGWEKNITKVYFKEPGLLREERTGGVVMIQNITAEKTLRYDPSTKTATLYPFKPQTPWLAFRKFLLDENRKWGDGTEQPLGEREVDGKKAQGFAVRENESKVWNIWIDASTSKLLRLELVTPDWKTHYNTIMLNPNLPDTLFSVEPPKGYNLEDKTVGIVAPNTEQRRAQELEKEAAEKAKRRAPK